MTASRRLNRRARALLRSVNPQRPSAESRERSWRRLEARIEGRGVPTVPRWLGVSATVALVALVFGLWFSSSPPRAVTEVLEVEGAVSSAGRDVYPGKSVAPEPDLKVGRNASTTLRVGTRATVDLAGPAKVAAVEVEESGAVEIALPHGRIRNDVESLPGVPYAVTSGRWRVEALGTVFVVERALGAEELLVVVEEGSVRVTGPGVDQRLRAPASNRFEPVVQTVPLASATVEAMPFPTLAKGAEPTPIDLKSEGRARKAKRRGGMQIVKAAPSPVQPVRAPVAPALVAVERGDDSRVLVDALDWYAKAFDSEFDELARYRTAARLLEAGRLDEAGVGFAVLAERHPDGALSLERQLGALEVAIGLAQHQAALETATEILSRRGLGASLRSETRYWRGESLRRLQRCRPALDDFAAVASRDGPRAEDAQWSRVWCLQNLGEAEHARSEGIRYLARHPSGRFADDAQALIERLSNLR
ncbi:MAG: FecR domain-containing protein [Myxococcota bacterium]